jgi:hypothetical protein
MQITKSQLRKIINEEMSRLIENPVRTFVSNRSWPEYKRDMSTVSMRSGDLAGRLGDAMEEEEFRNFLRSNRDLRDLLRDIQGDLRMYQSTFHPDRLPDNLPE